MILRKVNTSYTALSGGVFTIWKGNKKVSGTNVSGTANAESFTSGESGVFYIDVMDYGTYLIEETTAPSGYQKGWYYFILDGDHELMSAVFTGDDAKADAKAAADEYNKAIKLANQIINGKSYTEATTGITDARKTKVNEMLNYVGKGNLISSGS